MQNIRIRGARTHNLKNIDLDLPRDQLIVLTGLSGSGKSSLAFDIAGKGIANPSSMIAAIEYAWRAAMSRERLARRDAA